MRISWRLVALLAAIWLVAGAVIVVMRTARPTPESVSAYIEAHPLEGRSPGERSKVIERVAAGLNRLDFDQRQELRRIHSDRKFFEQMTTEERQRFLDLTLPEGFHQLMNALNKMEPARRKKLVQRVLADMERDAAAGDDRMDREAAQKIISQGMESFYSDASAEVKLEFAPVIERLQLTIRGMR